MNTFRKTWNRERVEDTGSTMSSEAKSFVRAFKNMLKRELEGEGIEIVRFEPNHYDCSGFLKQNDKYIYISYSIPRGYSIDFDSCSSLDGVLYRTVKNDKDFRGGRNNFSSLRDLPNNIIKMFNSFDDYIEN